MQREAQTFGNGSEAVRVENPLSIAGWDEDIRALPGAGFFHSQAWTRVLVDTYGYTPCSLVVREGGRLTSALPLLEVDSWLTGRRGVCLPFTDAVPPLCSSAQEFRVLFDAALAEGRRRAWKYVEVRGGKPWLPEAPPSTRFYQHILELGPDPDVVFKKLDSSTQRAIRKSGREGIAIDVRQDAEAMRIFYRLMCQTRQRHGVPPQPYRFFAAIQRQVLAANHGWIVLALHQKRPVAGAVFFHFGRSAIYKFGASDMAFQQLRANNLVMWEAIRRFASEGRSTLDFGRTSLNNEGLRRFKTGWAATEQIAEYIRYDLRENAFGTASDSSSGWHTRVFNALPQWMARPIGAALYPHMG